MFIGFGRRTLDLGLATVDCGLVFGAVSLLVGGVFRVRLHCRQFFERVHLPAAAEHEHRHAEVALPALRIFHPVVSEYSARDMARVARPLQQLRRADFAALFHSGIVERRGVFELLAEIRRSESSVSIHANRSRLRGFSGGIDCGDVY